MSIAMNIAKRALATPMIPPASRVVASIEHDACVERPAHTPAQQQKQIQVTGVAQRSCQADRAKLRIRLGSSKESVKDVTNSISRRLDYIVQTLRQHGVKDEDASVSRYLHREDDRFHMDAEIVRPPRTLISYAESRCSYKAGQNPWALACVARASYTYNATVDFSDFQRMEAVTSVLLEKLDRSVCVSAPQFYHSEGCLSQLRQRVCVSAVDDAREKASEVSLLFGQCLGPPLLVREEETREWINEAEMREEDEEEEENVEKTRGAPQFLLPYRPTARVSTRVSVSFSLKERPRKRL